MFDFHMYFSCKELFECNILLLPLGLWKRKITRKAVILEAIRQQKQVSLCTNANNLDILSFSGYMHIVIQGYCDTRYNYIIMNTFVS